MPPMSNEQRRVNIKNTLTRFRLFDVANDALGQLHYPDVT
jgi:hypothetical protein